MTAITLPAPIALEAPTPAPAHCFAASDAFRALRAWRTWAARSSDRASTGFALLRSDDGTLLLASENLPAESICAIALETSRRLVPVPGPRVRRPEPDGAACVVASLRSLDDWAIEALLRTGAAVSRSLIVALHHREGRFQLVAWPRDDAADPAVHARELLTSLAPWAEH
jgi:hypothetical protein